MKGNNVIKKLHFIVTSLVIIFVVSLSIGFSSFNTEMSISGIVSNIRPERDVRITGLKLVENTGDTYVGYTEYSDDKMFFEFSLNDQSAKLVYEVEITIFGSRPVAFATLQVEGEDFPYYNHEGVSLSEILCDENGKCSLGAKKTYQVTFENSVGDFSFYLYPEYLDCYNITYEGVTGDYPAFVVDGDSLYIEFPPEYNYLEVWRDNEKISDSEYSFIDGIFSKDYVDGNYTIKLFIRGYGDVNNDGQYNGSDKMLLSRAILGTYEFTDTDYKYADINGDGVLNEIDEALLTKVIMGALEAPGPSPLTNYIHYGDINEDNIVNVSDASKLNAYLKGQITLTDKQLLNADINGDDFVDKLDLELINAVAKKEITHNVANVLVDYPHYGDVDYDNNAVYDDYELIKQEIEEGNVLDSEQLVWADINADGDVNDVDLVLLMRVLNLLPGYEDFSILKPITDYVLYGDVHPDGVINSADLAELKLILAGSTIPTAQQSKNADVNGDGSIDSVDQVALNRALAGFENYLPDYPYSE